MTESPLETLLAASIEINRAVKVIDDLMRLVDSLELDRNTWRFRCEQAEMERNQWQHLAEELEAKYRLVARRAVELAIQTGEARCPECASASVAMMHGMFPTGVVAPDGGQETWYECALNCQECGHVEEMVP